MADTNQNAEVVGPVRTEGNAVIMIVRGDVDLHNSPELRSALLQILSSQQPKKLVLNLAAVPYMDSSAIAVLVESLQKLKRSGGSVVLTNLQPRVKGLLEIARLNTIFTLAKDEAEALSK